MVSKSPLWVSDELQKKVFICKSLLGCVNVEQVLIKIGIIELLNKTITDNLKKQTESIKNDINKTNKLI